MDSECKGCLVYRDHECGVKLIPYISETLQCPCRKCLVKVICKNGCEDIDAYGKIATKSLIKRRKERKIKNGG